MAITDDRQRRGAADLLSQIPTDGQRAAPLPDGSQSNPLNTEFGRNALNTLSALPGGGGGAMYGGGVAAGTLSRAAATAAQSAPVTSALSSLGSAAKLAAPYAPAAAGGGILLGMANSGDSSAASPSATPPAGSAAAALSSLPQASSEFGRYNAGQTMGPPNLSALNQPENSVPTSAAAQLSNVTREGNSYSGMNIGGDISINGAAPRGSVTTLPAGSAPAGIDVGAAQQLLGGMPSATTNGISAQSMGAADGLDARSQLESLSRLRASGQIAAPVAGPSMSLPGSTLGFRRAPSIVASELGAQRAFDRNMGRDPASLQRAAVLQQAQLEQQGANARALLSDLGSTRRTGMEQTGAMDRQALQTVGTVQAAQLRASQAAGKAPEGYRWASNGVLEAITGGPADQAAKEAAKPLNDVQSKALQFGARMQTAGQTLDQLAAGGVNRSGDIKRAADSIGLGALMNWTQSPEQQQVEQSQRDYVNAALRRESGAAIANQEFDNAQKQYFPQIGDSPDVIAQKRRNREIATAGVLAEVPNTERRVSQVVSAAQGPAAAKPQAAASSPTPAASQPTGATRQVGTSGGRPVYEDEQGRRFLARGG